MSMLGCYGAVSPDKQATAAATRAARLAAKKAELAARLARLNQATR